MNRRLYCHICHQEGHTSRDCHQQMCSHCGQEGHWKRNCPEITCYNCGRTGHVLDQCPEKNKFRMEICWTCGDPNHIRTSPECPGNPVPENWFCSYCMTKGISTGRCPCNKVTPKFNTTKFSTERNSQKRSKEEDPQTSKVVKREERNNNDPELKNPEVCDEEYHAEDNAEASIPTPSVSSVVSKKQSPGEVENSDSEDGSSESDSSVEWEWAVKMKVYNTKHVAIVCPKLMTSTINPRHFNGRVEFDTDDEGRKGYTVRAKTTICGHTMVLNYDVQYGNLRPVVLGLNAISKFRMEAKVNEASLLPELAPWSMEAHMRRASLKKKKKRSHPNRRLQRDDQEY